MPTGRVFVTRPFREAGQRELEAAGAEVRIWSGPEDASPSPREVAEGAAWADVLVTLLTEPIGRQLLETPRLRGVANMAVGYDNVDVAAATELGVPVSNTPDVLTDTTADLTWALLLAVARNVVPGDRYLRAGRYKIWGPSLLLGEDVSPGGDGRRKVLGIVGFGRIGQAVARRAVGFEMEVVAHDPHARQRIEAADGVAWRELDDLLTESDFVTLHTPATDETRHLIGAPQLGRMKRTAYLINAARGEVIDEKSLAEALRSGEIAGAGLDVYEREPEVEGALLELDNVVLLPHLGSASRGTRDRMATMAARNGLAMLAGERAPNCVNPEVYDGEAWRRRIESVSKRR